MGHGLSCAFKGIQRKAHSYRFRGNSDHSPKISHRIVCFVLHLTIHRSIKMQFNRFSESLQDRHLWWQVAQGLAYAIFAYLIGKLIGKGGMLIGIVLLAIPFTLAFLSYLFKRPTAALDGAMIVGFFSAGVTRYVAGPWGLLMDGFLFIGWLSMFFYKFRDTDWSPLRNDVMMVAIGWYGLVVLEILNPESNGIECWFYAIRGNGFYQMLSFGLVFMFYKEPRYLDRFLTWI